MKVFNLRCSLAHRFEGWFSSEDDYVGQIERGLLVCPICGNQSIDRLPSAPRIQASKARLAAQEPAPDVIDRVPAPIPQRTGDQAHPQRELTMQSMWLQAVRHVMAHTDDVGDRFPEEARRIHYGEIDDRPIRGRASKDEAEALREEGIEVMSLPLPEAMKGPLQ